MNKAKLLLTTLIISILALTQFALASAAPSRDEADFVSGQIVSVTQITDAHTGISIYEITLWDGTQDVTVRVTEETAYGLGLLYMDENGDLQLLDPESEDWPGSLEIPLGKVIPEEKQEIKHPVGGALAAFFSGLEGVDYDAIMAAHDEGYGFGVIAQALWLTQKLEGNAEVFLEILYAKETGDFSYFSEFLDLENGTLPTNWGQFRKAVMDKDKKNNLGAVMSGNDKDKPEDPGDGNSDNGNANENSNKDKTKDKVKDKEKSNNGNPANKNKP